MANEKYDNALAVAKAAQTCHRKHYCERRAFIMNNLYHDTEKKYDVVLDHTNDPEWDDPSDVTECVFSTDFKNEAEAYIEQHCPRGTIRENGVCKVCDLYDARKAALKEGRVRPFYIISYNIHQAYGGPEEGGWYYDWTSINGVRRAFTLEQGLRQVRAMWDEYPKAKHPRSSYANRSHSENFVVLCYAEDDPRWPVETTQRPRYE